MAWWVEVPRDVIRVSGPDALTYLQGQLSQDVAALDVGASAFSFLLQPQGKVDAYLRVTRTEDDTFVLDVDRGFGDAVMARLKRFKLRTKADIDALDTWRVIAVDGGASVTGVPVVAEVEGTVQAIGPDAAADAPAGDPAEYEARRIRAGVPRMGAEIDESTIPASVGVVDRSVSFTKGCYTGQELVARIDSRGGNTPTKLVGVRGDVAVGDDVVIGQRTVGRVTSAAGRVGLALVRRDVELPCDTAAGVLDRLPL